MHRDQDEIVSRAGAGNWAGMESLEERRFLSAVGFASISRGGTLSVSGTRHADHVTVARASKTYYVTVNSSVATFNARSVKSLAVVTGAGSDDVLIDDSVAPVGGTTVNGGAGDDSIQGGGGVESLNGEAGDDSITGGTGDDSLLGGEGSDSLHGGSGNCLIDGGNGVDHEIHGSGHDTLKGDANDDLQGDSNDTIDRHGSSNSGGNTTVHDSVVLGINHKSVFA